MRLGEPGSMRPTMLEAVAIKIKHVEIWEAYEGGRDKGPSTDCPLAREVVGNRGPMPRRMGWGPTRSPQGVGEAHLKGEDGHM